MTEDTTPAAAPVADRMAAARAARAAKLAQAKAPESTPAAAPVEAAAFEPAEPTLERSVAEPTILEKVAINQDQARQAKIEALRKAKAGHNTNVGEPMVQVRVLKRGAGLISMGDHVGGLGELTYDAGETPNFPQSVAQALEDKGLVEI